MPLPVSGAFHTPFMAPARDRLREAIAAADVRDTEIPVVSNVDAHAHDHGEEWSALLSAQLVEPGAVEALPARRSPSWASPTSPSSARAACSPAWPSASIEGARTISVATPEDLDKLLEWVGMAVPTQGAAVQGEHLFAVERLVVSPAAGIFTPIATRATER